MDNNNGIIPTGQKSKSKNIKIIVTGFLALVAIGLIGLFLVKPLFKLDNVSQGSEIGLVDTSYKEVLRNCPGNIELATVCSRNFYVKSSTEEVEKVAISTLKSKGYSVKRLAKGYDGPDQKALVAYSVKKDITLVVVATDTDNESYKISQGNVRIEAYFGKSKYDTQDLTEPEA